MYMDLVLIDVSGWIHRAFHAFPPLAKRDGTPTGALVGCLQTLVGQIDGGLLKDAAHVVAVLDAAGQTFRHALSPTYKAGRKRHPDIYPQYAMVKAAFAAFGIPTVVEPGVEADDVIAVLALAASEAGRSVAILSSDKDLTQLVRSTDEDGTFYEGDVVLVETMGTKRGQVTDYDAVVARWGVPPSKMASLLALMGDATDGVEGVPGIGEKTAAKLLANWVNLEDLLHHVDDLPDANHRHKLNLFHERARAAYRLVKLPSDDCPYRAPPAGMATAWRAADIDVDRVLAFCDEYEIVELRDEIVKKWTNAEVPGRELV